MKKKCFVILILLALSLLTAKNHTELEVGGYKIKLYPKPDSLSVKEDSTSYSCSALIEFDGNGLTICGALIGLNGQIQGMFPSGSELKWKKGKLYVNGKKPGETSDISLSMAFSRYNTTSIVVNLGCYELESKPYFKKYTQYSCRRNGKDVHFFIAGKANVEIDGDILYFNFKNYCKLKPGDSILIDNGIVFVNGAEISPEP